MRRVLLLLLLASGGCRIEPASEPGATETEATSGADLSAPEARESAQPPGGTDAPRAGPPVISARGWAVPVLGVKRSDLTDTFTDARSEGRSHDAIDILAPRGTPVVAASGGTVQRLFASEKGGLTVYVLGDDERTVSYYAHLDAYAPGLSDGQRVARGDRIGTVGDSGNAVPGNTHLHFAVWTLAPGDSFWDGTPLNPYRLLTK